MDNESRTVKTAQKKKRIKKRYALKFCLIILACVGIYFAAHIDYFNVNGIAVVGNKEISDEEIKALSEISEGECIFDVHPFLAQKKIKKNLYIEDVNVDRKLPYKIEIIVSERSGKAQLVFGKKYVVTDNSGTVLEISDDARKVTLVKGVEATEVEKGKTVKVSDTQTWSRIMKLISITEANDLYFKKIGIEDGKVKAYVYDKLVCKGRYDNVIRSIKTGELKSVIYDLYQKGIEKGVINIGSNDYCSFTP